jgi:hypothetical protein
MPVKGKGALRIAIEDFLTTFKLGDLIRGGVNTWIKSIEIEGAQLYAQIITDLKLNDYLPDNLKVETIRALAGSSPVNLVYIGAIIIGTVLGGFMGMGAPLSKLLQYTVDKTIRSARPAPVDLFRMIWRDETQRAELLKILPELGFADYLIPMVETILRPVIQIGELERLRLRGSITQADYDHEVQAQGWTADRIKQIQSLALIIPPVTDLVSMAVREAWSDEIARRFEYDADLPVEAGEWAEKQGLSKEWFRRYWRAHWQLPSPQMGYEMLHRLRAGKSNVPFTLEDMRTLLRTADYPTFFRDRLIEISYSPYTRVDVRRMYKLGILDKAGVLDAYLDLGYDEEKAANLTDFTVKYETEDGKDKSEVYKNLTASVLKNAYLKGAIDELEFRTRLAEIRYDPDDIELLVDLANLEKSYDTVPEDIKEHQSDTKKLLLAAYTARQITRNDAEIGLREIGLTSQAIEYNLAEADYSYQQGVRQDKIKLIGDAYKAGVYNVSTVAGELGKLNVSGAEQSQLLDEWDAEISHRSRKLTEAQYRKAWQGGFISETMYTDNLKGLGYSDADIELLVKMSVHASEE